MLGRKSFLLFAASVVVVGSAWLLGPAPAELEAAAASALEVIGGRMWLLFLAIAILPALGVPNCPLMIIGGGAAAVVHGTFAAAAVAVLAVIANILWSYWVAAYPLRAFLWERIERTAQTRWLARMDSVDVARATFILHVTPGVPLFIQNYFPGLHRLNYWKYLLIAVPVQSLYTALIVLTSGEILKVASAPMLVAAVVAVAAILIWKLLAHGDVLPDREFEK